ncbi:hypothetical protein [Escherichia coli]|uniref:hypothetical protein n=1 Tax=Escherichia coli TaxID=562 RepID=UPI003C30682F
MAENVAHISRFRKKKEKAYNVSNNQETGSGNDGGDGMNDDLERRVSCLESDVTEIKNNLITLTTRSESFATKSDVLEIREGLRLEMAESRQSLKSEMADLRLSLIVEMDEHRTELQ